MILKTYLLILAQGYILGFQNPCNNLFFGKMFRGFWKMFWLDFGDFDAIPGIIYERDSADFGGDFEF